MQDFRVKSRPIFSASLEEQKNPKFLAINHSAVSFDKDVYKGNKKIPTRFTILRPLTVGWGAAPYKQNTKAIGAKRLSELATTPEGPVTRMWSFEKSLSNMEKGPRVDDLTWELKAGNTLMFWLDEQRVREVREKLHMDRIEEFTVCEIQVAPKNNESAAKGSGAKIVEIKPCDFSLYSCLNDLDRFQSSLADARMQELKIQQTYPLIARDLVPEQVVFHTFVHHKAIINDDIPGAEFPMVQIANWGQGEIVDIPISVLLKYTNHAAKPGAAPPVALASILANTTAPQAPKPGRTGRAAFWRWPSPPTPCSCWSSPTTSGKRPSTARFARSPSSTPRRCLPA